MLVVVLVVAGEKQSIVIGIVTGSAYGLVALGLVLIYKSSGVFNFAQGEFGTVAVCTLYLLHSNDMPYGFAVIGALLAAMLFGFLTERIVIRPLFEAPRVILLVATAGVALLAIAIQQWLFDNQGRPIARAFPTLDRVTILDVQISDQRLWLIAHPGRARRVARPVLHHAPTSGWRSSAPARSRRRPSWSASACGGCRRSRGCSPRSSAVSPP